MPGQMAVNVLIGATLAGSFGSAIGGAVGQLGQLAAAGAMIGRAVSGAMAFEHTLTRTAITADMSVAATERLREKLRQLSLPGQTNQAVEDLEKGFNALVSAGMSAERAGESLGAIGRTATATGAAVEDLAKTSYVLVETLGVAPGALTRELDALAFAGKEGAFELADMAKEFPNLGAGAKNLGLQGSEAVRTLAAALQIAKRGAGSPQEAANNMQNFMKVLTSPEVLKNAKKAGINIKKVINTAMKNGENPLDAVLEAVLKKTKGDPFKIGAIFRDMQVQNFLKPLLADFEDYKKLKADIAAKSLGTVDADYARIMATTKEQAQGLANALDKAGDSLGRVFLADAGGLIGQLTTLTGFVDAFMASHPEQIRMAALAGLSVVAFRLLGGVGRQVGGAIAGMGYRGGSALSRLRKDFTDSYAATERFGNGINNGAARAGRGIVRLGSGIRELPGQFRAAGGASGVLRSGLGRVGDGAGAARRGLSGAGRGVINLGRSIGGIGNSLTALPGRLRAAGGAGLALRRGLAGAGSAAASLPRRLNLAGGAAGALRGTVVGLRTGIAGLRSGVGLLGRSLKGLFMANPLGWLMAAVEIGMLLYDSWKPFRDMVDKLWAGLKKVGSALADFFGFGDEEEAPAAPANTASVNAEEAQKRAKVQSELADMKKGVKPGTAAEQAIQKTVPPPVDADEAAALREEEAAIAAEEAAIRAEAQASGNRGSQHSGGAAALPPQEHTFKHRLELTINAPAGFTAQAKAAEGSNVSIAAKTGRIMGGPN